jgi:hypothetical protein
MKKIWFFLMLCFVLNTSNAQLIDLKNLDLSSLLGKAMNVKQGWAPKFSFGNLNIPQIAKVAKIINLKNVDKATKLFNTFKTGRTVYKAGAYVGLAASTYSTIKNAVESGKKVTTDPALIAAAQKAKSEAISKAQKYMVAGGATLLTGVIIKFLTKQAASKAADAFNGVIRKKITDILSFDAASPSMYAKQGVALKIRL